MMVVTRIIARIRFLCITKINDFWNLSSPAIDGNGVNPQPKQVHNIAAQPRANNKSVVGEDNNCGVVTGPPVKANVTLAKTACKSSKSLLMSNAHSI